MASDPLAALRAVSKQAGAGSRDTAPAIPSLYGVDPAVAAAIDAIRENLEILLNQRGDSLDAAVTWRGLMEKGIVSIDVNLLGAGGIATSITSTTPAEVLDLTPPPAPTNVTAAGAMTSILVQWDRPLYRNHAYAEIWSAQVNDLGQASLVGQSPGSMFPHTVGTGQTRYYWVRFVSQAYPAVPPGPYNAVAGVQATTANDPAWLLSVLTAQITESQLYAALNTRINLVDGPENLTGSVAQRLAAEAAARTTAIAAETSNRAAAIATETSNRVAAISQEVSDRNVAIASEARQRIDSAEASAEAILRNALSAHNEIAQRAGDLATARFEIKSDLTTGLSAEASARLELAAKVDTNTASIVAEQTARASGDTANAASITALTATVNTNTAAITAEQTARAAADSTEVSAREALATQLRGSYSGTDLAALTTGLLYQERIARSNQDNALAQQITLLSAGAGEQFDWKKIWYFDAGVESWDGNGTPTAAAGWLRPANQASGAYVFSPTGIAADGNQYPQVRLRVRKTGAPTFAGYLWWRAAADSTWDTARRVALAAPTWDANGIGLITVSPGWTVTVDRVRVDLSDAQGASDYFELDWVAIGRPSPGASSAQLYDEQTARAAADAAEVTSREALATKVLGATDPTGLTLAGLTAGLLYDERQTRATQDSALSSSITSLQATVTGNYNTLNAAITSEQTARASADSAETTARQSLSSKLTGAADPAALTLGTLASGLLYDERQARSSADAAEVSARETLAATVTSNYNTLNAAITSEQTARATADTAVTSSIDTLVATARRLDRADNQAAEALLRDVVAGEAVRSDLAQTIALARQEIKTDIIDGLAAEASARLTLAATVGANYATLVNDYYTRTATDSAISSAAAVISARLNTGGDTASAIAAAQTTATTGVNNAAAAQSTANAAVSSIATLTTTVNGNTTAIQTTQQSLDGVKALYMLKMDVNGVLSGFALGSELTGGGAVTSKAIWQVDQFAIVAPGRAAGTLASVPFAVLTTEQVINGYTFQPGVYIDGASINALSVGTAQIANLAVDNSKIIDLSAAKLKTGELSADTEITVGGRLKLSGDGWIESYSLNGYSRASDYARLYSGNLNLYRATPDGVVLYNFLSRIETGVGANNVEVTIPGYWKNQPRVIVSPANLPLFDPTYVNQAQAVECLPQGLQETSPGSMRYKFTPIARLTLGSGNGLIAVNAGSGDQGANTYTSDTYTTPANCTSITPNVSVKSVRGNGASQYYRRRVKWKVQYLSGGNWIDDLAGWRTVNMGDQTAAAVADSYTFAFPGAGTWNWRIAYQAEDTDGTTFGAISYTYTQEDVTSANKTSSATHQSGGQQTVTNSATSAFAAPQLSGEIYQIDYSWTETVSFTLPSGSNYTVSASSVCSAETFSNYAYSQAFPAPQTSFGPFNRSKSVTGSNLTFGAAAVSASTSAFNTTAVNGTNATVALTQLKATVKHRTPIANSTTPVNNFLLGSYGYALTSAQVLATGSLNWLAAGE